jgi:hypothetical protein
MLKVIKRLLNVTLIITIATYVSLIGTLVVVAYNNMSECEMYRSLNKLCASSSTMDCGNSDEAKKLQRRYEIQYGTPPPPPGFQPIKCAENTPDFWRSNFLHYAMFYSVAIIIALLLLLTVNYVFFGSLTLWHKMHSRG